LAELLHISDITIEGFRGVNKPLNLDFENRCVMIHGRNGVGKSTVLQAIEWCLMGQCRHMELDEFGREDALVNLFHPDKKASVTIRLTDGTRKYQLRRERKLGKSTRGKSQLVLYEGKQEYKNTEAEQKLRELLVSPEQFYAATYLRQDAIREFIVGDAQDRARVIDELLGLETLRQLLEAVPVKDVETAAKKVEKEIGDMKEGTIQALDLATKKLVNYKDELMKGGLAEKKLNADTLVQKTKDVATELAEIAGDLKVSSPKLDDVEENTASLADGYNRLDVFLDRLDRERFGFFKAAENRRSELQHFLEEYTDARSQMAEFKEQDPEELQSRVEKLRDEIKPLETERDGKNDLAEFLNDKRNVLKGLQSDANKAQHKLEALKKYGSIEEIEESVRGFDMRLLETARLKRETGAYTQLLKSAADFLAEAKPEKCPVCNRPVQHAKLRRELLLRMDKAQQTKIEKIEATIDELKDKKREYKDAAVQINDLTREIRSAQTDLAREIQEIEKKIKSKLKEPLDIEVARRVTNLRDSAKQIDEKARGMEQKSQELENQIKRLGETIRRKEKLEDKIQRVLGVVQTDEKLIQAMKSEMKSAETEIGKLNKINERFPKLKMELTTYKKILEYLEESERVKKLEKEMPDVQERIKKLERNSEKLRELFMGLSDIHEVLRAEKESILESTLDRLQDSLGSYYSRILGHPYFVNLQLTPEEEKKGIVYRIVAYDESKNYSTYVQTRFSNAQTNATALSLFLAMAGATTSQLGMLVLDDPGQSLDTDHKNALANILAAEAKEKQFIVATQDEEMKSLIEEAVPKTRLKCITFKDWSPQAGPS